MSSVIPVDDERAFLPATVKMLALPALVFTLLFSHPTFATDVPFASQSVLSTLGDGAYSVSAADVDGDGDLDVVSSSFNDNTIVWFENNESTPPGWTRRVISTTAMGAYWSFAADVDGDGDIDVLSASFADDKIAWYENNGASPPTWTAHNISITADGARSVYAADVDGDGDMDVLSASINDSKIAWYENTGLRIGWVAHTISQAGAGARSVFAADVDGDGDMDVLAAFSDTDQISWYENLGGSPLAWTARTITTTADGAQTVFAADLDGDGDTDVLSASFLDDTIAWYENDGAVPPSFTKKILTTTADGAWGVYAADVDGDGDLDVLSASSADGRIAWYENKGTTPPTWNTYLITTLAVGARSVSAADLDGDGDTDVFSADFDDDKVAWYENRTIHRSAGFFEQRVISTAADYVESVFAADVDGDGDIDALSASEIDDTIAWYPNLDGAGTFGTLQVITTTADSARSVHAADVDGDGDIDALSASVNDDKIAFYENLNGAGTSWQTHVISTTADGAVKVVAADVDGDGDVDALSISNFDSKVAWYENVGGAGDVWSEHVIATDAAGGWDVFAADVDGDGDTDVLYAAAASNTFAWYENLDGISWTKHVISTARAYPLSIFAADIDGDGDADALTATYSSHTLAWHEQTVGGGPPWVEHVIDTTAQGFWRANAADLDHDGDLDVVAILYPDHLVVRYENLDGAGTFGPQKVIAPSLYLFSATTADFDGDGDRDVLTGSGTDLIAWYPNLGGQFSLVTTDIAPPALTAGLGTPVLRIQVNHRGRANDSDLELATLELQFERVSGDSLTTAEANALIENLYVARDNGDGVFNAPDILVTTVGTLSLVGGRQTVTFADGDPNVRVPATESRTFFVALDMAAGAAGQTPNDFRVTHVTESGSSAEDVSSDIRLSLEFVPNVTTDPLGFGPQVSSVVPPNNTLKVPVGTNVTVVFSEPVNPATVNTTSFRLLDPLGTPVAASVGLAPDGKTATLDPAPPGGALAFNTVYTVEVTNAVKDLAGIPAVPFKSYFATAAGPITGIALPTVADQSVLPSSPPPGPGPGGASTAASLLTSTLGPNLGYSVSAAGDLNNDQLADFVGGAPGYDLAAVPEAGAVAIYLGSNASEPSSGNHPREIADVIYTGSAAHERAGSSVAANFDFNGDGIKDILIGAEQVNRTVDPPQVTGTGKVYLIYFKPQEYDFDHNNTPDFQERSEVFVPLSLVGTTISGAVLTGVGSGDQAGYAVAAGGLLESSDTRDDLVIGAPGANGGSGKAYVLFSSSGVTGTKSLGEVGVGIPGVVYVGSAGERLGASVALPGDVTVPVGPDIALGAPLADTTQVDAGRLYVAAAGALVAGTVNASSIPTQVQGDQACEALGFAVAGGGDNRASGTPQLAGGDSDLLIGAPYFDTVASPGNTCLDTTPVPNAGRVIQTTARLPGSLIAASQVGITVEGVIWRGVQAQGGLGWSVGRLGDLSGNHLDDIGLSAPFVSPGMSGAGAVYVVEGSANTGLLGSINADQVGQIVSGGIFLGTQTGEEAGLALCAAGDLDGDGLTGSLTADDFAVGSPGWDASLGTVHQVLGTLLQQPGECTSLGCTVADLQTGAVLVVPPNAIATGLKYRFALQNAPSLIPSCGIHPAGKTVAGWTNYTRTDCSTPPCTPPGLAIGPNLEVPTRQELEYQLTLGESLDLRYCDTDTGLGWRSLTAPTTGQVQNNSYVAGRKAVKASGVDTLRLYGVLFNDQDHDEVRDTCDCGPQNASIWSAPGPPGDLILSGQSTSPTTITWSLPGCPGGSSNVLLYDTIRSTNRADFVNGAVCVETNGTDLTSTDQQNPPVGQAFYYIVSPENGCSSGGTCQLPTCVQTPARDC